MVAFHTKVKRLIEAGRIKPIDGWSITIRGVLQSSRLAVSIMRRKKCSPLEASVTGIMRTYLNAIPDVTHHEQVMGALAEVLEQSHFERATYAIPPEKEELGGWSTLYSKLHSLEHAVYQIIWQFFEQQYGRHGLPKVGF